MARGIEMSSESSRRDRGWWYRLVGHLASIIDVYDEMNTVMSLGMDKRVRRELVDLVVSECGKPLRALDVGSGPGTLLEYVAGVSGYVVALDPIPEMLEVLSKRLSRYQHLVDRVVAVGEHIPLRGKSVDVVLAAFSLRDFIDWARGLEEFTRVARRCYAVLDIARRRGLALLAQLLWWGVVVPLAALAYGKNPSHYLALARTILGWALPEEIARTASLYARSVRLEKIAGGFAFRLLVHTSTEDRCSGERCKRYTVCSSIVRGAEDTGMH